MIDLESLKENIEKIRVGVCAYATTGYCDCKFGGPTYNVNNPGSENFSGCAELRTVLDILNNLTEEEYERLIK